MCVGYAKIYKTDLIGFWEKKIKNLKRSFLKTFFTSVYLSIYWRYYCYFWWYLQLMREVTLNQSICISIENK